MNLKEELGGMFGAKVPLINLVTYEEDRMIQAIAEVLPADRGVYAWDLADGFRTVREGAQPLPPKEVNTDSLLPHLEQKAPDGCAVILKDFHHSWNRNKPLITRKLRNMAPRLRARGQCLVFVTPFADLPAELKDDVAVLHVPLPDADELKRLFQEITRDLGRSRLPGPEVQEKLILSSLGLTTNLARMVFAKAYARHGQFDERSIEIITWAKREVIRESGALEFWPAGESEASVGGLDLMKAWLKKREKGFTSEARAAGVPYPRGVALIGIPGTGKSLSAKMLSDLWKLPLLRLDVGAVFGSLLGESEANIRRAISLAETVSPCILWIDEMEKAFAGASPEATGSGAATRVFGSFLTWMQEHKTPVFVIATANEVKALPPELMGRFERTFFLDLPNEKERREILLIHLKRAGAPFPERSFRMDELVDRTRGFVGREIERAVREAQFMAFDADNREISHEDLLAAIREVIPIVKSHEDVIKDLGRWKTEGRASPASSEEQVIPTGRGRQLDV